MPDRNPNQQSQQAQQGQQKRKNATIILIPLLVLLAGGGAAAWWLTKSKSGHQPPAGGGGAISAPTGLTASVTQSGTQMNVHMSWNQVPGATSYTWEVIDSSGNVVARGQVSGTSADTTLPAGGSYSFHVQACA